MNPKRKWESRKARGTALEPSDSKKTQTGASELGRVLAAGPGALEGKTVKLPGCRMTLGQRVPAAGRGERSRRGNFRRDSRQKSSKKKRKKVHVHAPDPVIKVTRVGQGGFCGWRGKGEENPKRCSWGSR